MSNVRAAARFAALALAASLAAGCSGGGASPAPSAPRAGSTGLVNLVIKGGTASSTSKKRSPQNLSYSAKGVSISINGGTPALLSLTGCNETTSQTGTQCQMNGISAPAGTDTFVVSVYDQVPSNGAVQGNLLGSGSVTSTVAAGQTNAVVLTLSETIGSGLGLQLSTSVPPTGSATTITVFAQPSDADSNEIFGTLTNPITLTKSDPDGTVTLSATTISSTTSTVTATYSGATSTPVTITGTAMYNGNAITQSVTIAPGTAYPQLAIGKNLGYPTCSVLVFNAAGTGSEASTFNEGTGDNGGCATPLFAPSGHLYYNSSNSNGGFYSWPGFVAAGAIGVAATFHNAFVSHTDELITSNVTSTTVDAFLSTSPTSYAVTVNEYDLATNPIVNFLPNHIVQIPAADQTYPAGTVNADINIQPIEDVAGNLWVPGVDGLDEYTGTNGPATKVKTIAYAPTMKGFNNFEFGPSGELWVCDHDDGLLFRVAPGATTMSNPSQSITGTDATNCGSLHVDSAGELYTQNGSSIDVFAPNATGAALPLRSIITGSGSAFAISNF